jgi:predicted lipoprotein with Yx(FWY)xxD motif
VPERGSAPGYGGGQPAGTGRQPTAAGKPVVIARNLAGIGTVLVDRSGKTIYSPGQEVHGTIRCTGSCLGFWFPVPVSPGTPLRAPQGVNGVLGIIRRKDDGITQLSFNGRPLYTFRLDQAPGQAHGNNFSDSFGGTSYTWQVVAASGSTSRATQSAKPGGGYSYPASGAYEN